MQVINWLEVRHLPAEVDAFNANLPDAVIFAIQALCAAGPRKVASRADIFQGTNSPSSRHLLYTLTCFGAGIGRDFIQ